MKRPQLLLVGAALVVAAGMLTLPTGVLKNGNKPAPTAGATRDGAAPAGGGADATQSPAAGAGASASVPAAGMSGEAGHEGHDHEHPHRELTAAERTRLNGLRTALRRETQPAGRAARAAELAAELSKAQQYDSAGAYYELAAQAQPGPRYARLAADQYFEAFGFAATPQRGQELAAKAQGLYQQVLKAEPDNLDAKTNLAMTYVASPQPMQGVLLLREVIQRDPTNEKALYNLGMLSMQSGQWDKAVGRFRELVKAHPQHVNGNFYLGVTLAKTGDKAEARKAFERTLTLSNDPSLKASVEQELAQLR